MGFRNFLSDCMRKGGNLFLYMSKQVRGISVTVIGRDGEWIICRSGDLIWRLDPTQYLDNQIIRYGFFEPESTHLIRQIIKPRMVVLDVGANFGYYTVNFSKLVGESGHIYAFEPSKRFRKRLVDHLTRNKCKNITVLDFGLSNREGTLTLYGGDSSATLHPIPDFMRPTEEENVQLRTLDSFVSGNKLERVDFVKVDIDGHEPEFVAGAMKTLADYRPILLMEFAQLNLMKAGSDVVKLSDQLKSLGYVFCSEETGKPFPNETTFLRTAMNCSHSVNVLCYPKEKAPGQ